MSWPEDDWWTPQAVTLPDGTALAVRSRVGEQRPLVLLHGRASNALLWRDGAEQLQAHGHGVMAVDLRGHGRSDRPPDGYSTTQAARDICDVVELLGKETSLRRLRRFVAAVPIGAGASRPPEAIPRP